MPAAKVAHRPTYLTESALRYQAERLTDALREARTDDYRPASAEATVPLVLEDLRKTTPSVWFGDLHLYLQV